MTKMKENCWQFKLPWQCIGAMWGALPDETHLGLNWKPLDAAIKLVPAPCLPGSRNGQ